MCAPILICEPTISATSELQHEALRTPDAAWICHPLELLYTGLVALKLRIHLRGNVLPGRLLSVAALQQAGVDVVLPRIVKPHTVVVVWHDIEVPVAPLVLQAVSHLRRWEPVGKYALFTIKDKGLDT